MNKKELNDFLRDKLCSDSWLLETRLDILWQRIEDEIRKARIDELKKAQHQCPLYDDILDYFDDRIKELIQ